MSVTRWSSVARGPTALLRVVVLPRHLVELRLRKANVPPGHTVKAPASPHGMKRTSPYIHFLLCQLPDNKRTMTMSRYPAHRNG